MKTRYLVFSLVTAVGIYVPASPLMANEPYQPDEITQTQGEPSADYEAAIEQDADFAEELTDSEDYTIVEEADAIEDSIEQVVADENELQETAEGLDDESNENDRVDESVEPAVSTAAEESTDDEFADDEFADEEFANTELAEEETTDEEFADEELADQGWLDWYEVPTEDAEDVDANVPAVEEASAEDATLTEEEVAEFDTDDELIEEDEWAGDYDEWTGEYGEWFYEGEIATEEFVEEETIVDETVEAIDAIDVEATEETAADEALTEVVEPAREEADEVEIAAEEATEEAVIERLNEDVIIVEEPAATTEAVDVEESVLVTESTVEVITDEESAEYAEIEEAADVQVTEEIATDEESTEYVEIEEAADVQATEEIATDEESVEYVEIEEAELPQSEDESTTADDAYESEAVAVRTLELTGWKVTVESETEMDNLQMLNMLRAAIYQLEAEMD